MKRISKGICIVYRYVHTPQHHTETEERRGKEEGEIIIIIRGDAG